MRLGHNPSSPEPYLVQFRVCDYSVVVCNAKVVSVGAPRGRTKNGDNLLRDIGCYHDG